MTEQEKLEFVLSARNTASKDVKALTEDVKKLARELLATQRLMNVVFTGKTGQGPKGHQGAYRRFASDDPKVQLRAAKLIIAEMEAAEKKAAKEAEQRERYRAKLTVGNYRQEQREAAAAAKEDERRATYRARLIVGNYKQERREAAEAAREKARQDKEDERRATYKARLIRGNYAQEQREAREAAREKARIERETTARLNRERRERVAAEREANKLIADSRRQTAKEEAEKLKQMKADDARRSAAQTARSQRMSSFMSGGGQVISGVGGLASNILAFGRQLLTVTGYAFNFARAVGGAVVDAIQNVERKAAIATAAMLALGAAVGASGFKFNEFKEDTMTTLAVLTEKFQTAKEIFDFSFELAIPAAFPFRDILEAGRTLESFGLKFKAYGRETGEYIKSAVMLAQGMQKPLAQVTRFLGNLSQGRLLLQQAAPLAMGRPTLAKYGIKFDSHGSAINREQLATAAMRAIEDRWGGILEKMKDNYSTMLDSMKSYSELFFGEITQGMFRSFARAMGNVAQLFKELTNPTKAWSKSLKEALKVPFDLFGAFVENASKWLPKVAKWMSQIVTKENIVNALAEVVSLFQVIYEDVKNFVQQNVGDKGLVGIWEMFRDTAVNAVDEVLEVWTEFKTILQFLSENGDQIWKAITDGAKSFVSVLEVIAGLMVLNFGAGMIGNIAQIFTGFGKMKPAGFSAGSTYGTPPGGQTPPGAWDQHNKNIDMLKKFLHLDNPGGTPDQKGPAGFIQGIGRWAIGGALDFGKSNVPDSMKNLWSGYQSLREKNMGQFQTDKARRHGFRAAAKKNIESMLGGVMETPKDPDNSMPPATNLLKGLSKPWEQADLDTLLAQNSAEVVKAKIKAFEKGIQGYDSNDRAIVRQQGAGLYQAKLGQDAEKVRSTYKEAMTRTTFDEETGIRNKDRDEQVKDLQEYWDAVEDMWDTQAEIQKINREAQDAITNKFKEANEARTNLIESQIEMLPDSEKSAARAQNLIPMLIEKQQILLGKLKTVQQGTKEYYDILGESWNAEKQINDLRTEAADDQANKAFHRPTRQISTLKKLIGMMPKGQRRGAMAAMIGPRIQQAYQAAMMERDPEKREDKLLEVMDLFTAFKEDQKKSDPFGGMFGKAKAGQRAAAIRNYQRNAFGGRAKKGRTRGQSDIFAAMSPFAPSPEAGGGGGFNGDNFTQLIFNLPTNATEQQMADFVARTLQQQLTNVLGR